MNKILKNTLLLTCVLFSFFFSAQLYKFDYMLKFDVGNGKTSKTRYIFLNSKYDHYYLEVGYKSMSFLYDFNTEKIHYFNFKETGFENYKFDYSQSENFYHWENSTKTFTEALQVGKNNFILRDYLTKKKKKLSLEIETIVKETPFSFLYIFHAEIPPKKILLLKNFMKNQHEKENNFTIELATVEFNQNNNKIHSELKNFKKVDFNLQVTK